MKILNIMSSKILGGVEQAFLNYNKLLSLIGFEVFAIYNKNGKIKQKLEKIDNVNYLPSIFFKPYFLLFPYYYFKIKKIKPDFILVQTKKVLPLFAKIGKMLNIPVILIAHNDKIKLIDKADYIFSITQYQKNIFVKNSFDESKIFVIPNVIDKIIDFQEFKDFSNPPVFGTMFRFDPMKGIPVLIEACRILKEKNINFKLKIGGSPQKQYLNEYNKILNLIKKYNLENNIELTGWVDNIENFYKSIDIFILPSIYEPFGIVLLEAMIHSEPIISSLAEGPSEIFKNTKNDFVFSVGNYEKLAELMIKMINNKELAKKIVEDNYKMVNEKYSLIAISRSLKEVFNKINN